MIPFPNGNGRSGIIACSDTENEDYQSSTDASYYSTDLDAPLRDVDEEREGRRKRLASKQQQDQRAYVSMTPQIMPGAENSSPITTWGTLDSTPLVLAGNEMADNSNTTEPSSSFHLSGENARDRLARKAESELGRRAKRAKESSLSSGQRHGTNKNLMMRTQGGSGASLTPAALSLFEKTKRVPSRSREAFASALRTSYTPQRRSSASSSKTPSKLRQGGSQYRKKSDTAYNATPILKSGEK